MRKGKLLFEWESIFQIQLSMKQLCKIQNSDMNTSDIIVSLVYFKNVLESIDLEGQK